MFLYPPELDREDTRLLIQFHPRHLDLHLEFDESSHLGTQYMTNKTISIFEL